MNNYRSSIMIISTSIVFTFICMMALSILFTSMAHALPNDVQPRRQAIAMANDFDRAYETVARYGEAISQASARYGVPQQVLLRVLVAESLAASDAMIRHRPWAAVYSSARELDRLYARAVIDKRASMFKRHKASAWQAAIDDYFNARPPATMPERSYPVLDHGLNQGFD